MLISEYDLEETDRDKAVKGFGIGDGAIDQAYKCINEL